ncbi:hypothetical protein [Candidatus Hodgkinia cicadicola]|uniref:hypothetical protein n=1 Tax=Candidatus Hodgkinia cicadicola TaxID=573658 RepID=UPI0011BA92CF
MIWFDGNLWFDNTDGVHPDSTTPRIKVIINTTFMVDNNKKPLSGLLQRSKSCTTFLSNKSNFD